MECPFYGGTLSGTGRTGRDKQKAQNVILFKDENEKIPDIIFGQNTEIEILKNIVMMIIYQKEVISKPTMVSYR